MKYRELVLDRLLDKYERSKAYVNENAANRRIMLKLCGGEFPEYNLENTEIRELINSVIFELWEKGLVEYEWFKFEHGNIIDKVWLKLDRVDDTYIEAKRTSKRDKVDAIFRLIEEQKEDISKGWIRKFLEDVQTGIEKKKTVKPILSEEPELVQALLKAFKAINDMGEEEYLERVFSLRCFGDSKYFERNIRKRLIDIVKRYLLMDSDGSEDIADDEVLSQVGLVRAPEQFDFCGNLVGRVGEYQVDFSAFKHGITINSQTVREIEIKAFKSIDKLLFIENKANYLDYILKKKKENELVVFHGGFYSPIKGLLFKKLYDAGQRTGVKYYHWGDIDVGGFRIFHRLKKNIIPELKPVLMDRAALCSKKQYWMSFDDKYAKILKEMYENKDFEEFQQVIEVMLEEKVRLEQEAFL